MKKSILLFGAPGASSDIEALTKAHVGGYTRKDGTYVQEHEDGRQAAQSAPATESKNKDYGFYGEALNQHIRDKHGDGAFHGDLSSDQMAAAHKAASKRFSDTAHHLVSAGHFKTHEEARNYLDSKHGRHLHDGATFHGGDVSKVPWLKKDVADHKAETGKK